MTCRSIVFGACAATRLLSPPTFAAAGEDTAKYIQLDNAIHVQLRDFSSDANMAGMAIESDRTDVKPGKVILEVDNSSKWLTHEVVVIQMTADAALPYDDHANAVNEHRVRKLGEVPDLLPGGHGSLQLTLKPGRYELICNQPGHYHAGMAAMFSVTP